MHLMSELERNGFCKAWVIFVIGINVSSVDINITSISSQNSLLLQFDGYITIHS